MPLVTCSLAEQVGGLFPALMLVSLCMTVLKETCAIPAGRVTRTRPTLSFTLANRVRLNDEVIMTSKNARIRALSGRSGSFLRLSCFWGGTIFRLPGPRVPDSAACLLITWSPMELYVHLLLIRGVSFVKNEAEQAIPVTLLYCWPALAGKRGRKLTELRPTDASG